MSELAAEVADVAEVEATDETTPDVTADAAAQDAATSVTPVPAAGFDPNNLEHLQAAAAALQGMGYTIGQATPDPAATPAAPATPDPYADDYAAQLEAWYEAKRQQDLAPMQAFAQYIEDQQATETDANIDSAIGTARTKVGYTSELVTNAEIRGLARQYALETTQRLPDWQVQANSDRILSDSIERAVQTFADRSKQDAEAGVKAYLDSLTEGGGNLLEPGIRTGALPSQTETPMSEREAAAAFNRRRAAQPV